MAPRGGSGVRENFLRGYPLEFKIPYNNARASMIDIEAGLATATLDQGTEAGQDGQGTRVTRRSARLLGVNWAFLFVDFFQVMVVFLNMALFSTHPEPSLLDGIGWMTIPGLDFWTFAASRVYSGASSEVLVNKMNFNYAAYFWVFVALPVVLYLGRGLSRRFLLRHLRDINLARASLAAISYSLGYILLLPVGIAVLRPFVCDERTGARLLYVDNAIECDSTDQLLYQVVGATITAAWGVSLVWAGWRRVHRSLITFSSVRHEAQIQSLEAAYESRADDTWLLRRSFFWTSFTRRGAFHWVTSGAFKLAILIALTACTEYPITQTALVTGIYAVQAVHLMSTWPYRVKLLNAMHLLVLLCGMGLNLVTLLKRTGLQQALLEAPHYNRIILFVVYLTFACLLTGTLYHVERAWRRRRRVWPQHVAAQAEARLSFRGVPVARLILAARQVLEMCWRLPAHLAPIHEATRYLLLTRAALQDNTDKRPRTVELDQVQDQLLRIVDDLETCRNSLQGRSVFSLTAKPSAFRYGRELLANQDVLANAHRRWKDQTILRHPKFRRVWLRLQAWLAFAGAVQAQQRRRSVRTASAISSVTSLNQTMKTDFETMSVGDEDLAPIESEA